MNRIDCQWTEDAFPNFRVYEIDAEEATKCEFSGEGKSIRARIGGSEFAIAPNWLAAAYDGRGGTRPLGSVLRHCRRIKVEFDEQEGVRFVAFVGAERWIVPVTSILFLERVPG